MKSVFAKGKHKVQYEIRTYYCILKFRNLTSSTSDTFLEYIQRNLPEGVALKITKVSLLVLHLEKVYKDLVRVFSASSSREKAITPTGFRHLARVPSPLLLDFLRFRNAIQGFSALLLGKDLDVHHPLLKLKKKI